MSQYFFSEQSVGTADVQQTGPVYSLQTENKQVHSVYAYTLHYTTDEDTSNQSDHTEIRA